MTLYFADGDLVLSVPGKDEIVLLRVHRAVLSHHSEVFAEMLSLPSNATINETYDDTPLVHMHDDANNLTKLIAATYNFKYVRHCLCEHTAEELTTYLW